MAPGVAAGALISVGEKDSAQQALGLDEGSEQHCVQAWDVDAPRSARKALARTHAADGVGLDRDDHPCLQAGNFPGLSSAGLARASRHQNNREEIRVKRAGVLALAGVIAAAALAASACGSNSDTALQSTVTPSSGTMPVSRSSSPSSSPSPARRHHRAHHHHPAVAAAPPASSPGAAPAPSQASGAWCTATASVYNAEYNWNNVYVSSNQPYTDATASADGYSWSYETNGSGYAVIYLNGPPPGAEITVTVGAATCTTSD
jgi:hypothetical protein